MRKVVPEFPARLSSGRVPNADALLRFERDERISVCAEACRAVGSKKDDLLRSNIPNLENVPARRD